METKREMPKAILLPELIEGILRLLPIRSLLTCQRVCRTWNQVISSSHHLQEALFFKPAYGCINRIQNPLIHHAIWTTSIPYEPDSALARPEASWRRMLLQQPPTSKIGLINLLPPFSYANVDWQLVMIETDKELRSGDLPLKFPWGMFNGKLVAMWMRSADSHGRIVDIDELYRRLDPALDQCDVVFTVEGFGETSQSLIVSPEWLGSWFCRMMFNVRKKVRQNREYRAQLRKGEFHLDILFREEVNEQRMAELSDEFTDECTETSADDLKEAP